MCENVRVGGGTPLRRHRRHRRRANLTKQNGGVARVGAGRVGGGGVTNPINSFVFPVMFHI